MSIIMKDNEHPQRILSTLSCMRNTGIGCTAVLSTEDGGMFRVHKSVMSCCSPYFRTVFTTSLVDMSCGDEGQPRTFIAIPNVSGSMLEIIIQYAYSGTTLVTKNNVNKLLPAADQFNVQGMVDDCTDFLVGKLEPDNCIGIWRFGKEYLVPSLETEAFKFVLEHFQALAKESFEFLELSPCDLRTILMDDALNVFNESFVWYSIKIWLRYDRILRLRHVPSLLAYVRLATMSVSDFQGILDDPIVYNNVKCKPYLALVSKFILRELDVIKMPNEMSKIESLFVPRLPNEVVFCVGGWGRFGPAATFEAYDCRADTWKRIELEERITPRLYHQCISLGDYMYVIGGSDGYIATNSCCRFNTITMKFEKVSSMHEQRCFLSAVQLNSKIYAIGGYDGYNERSHTVEFFSPKENQWAYVAPMYTKRSDASACHLENRIFVVGGFDGSTYLKSAEVYYEEFNQWYMLPDMNSCRSGLECIVMGDTIFAVGGCDGNKRLQSVEKYDMTNKQWYAAKPMTRPRSNFAIEILENKIYVMGGYDDVSDTTTKECECFDPRTHRWKRIAPLTLGRSGLSACTFSGLRNIHNFTMENTKRSVLRKFLADDSSMENVLINNYIHSNSTISLENEA